MATVYFLALLGTPLPTAQAVGDLPILNKVVEHGDPAVVVRLAEKRADNRLRAPRLVNDGRSIGVETTLRLPTSIA